MQSADFDTLANLLKFKSGLVLTPDKAYLIESRLLPVARKWNLSGLEQLVGWVRNPNCDPGLTRDIVEAMTTNESSFFRDIKPFDQFRQVTLPRIAAARQAQRSVRIWSAACSSGQEPFSLMMILEEEQPKYPGFKFEILATDLSTEMVDRCKQGYFSQFEVQRGLPVTYLVKHFKQQGDRWQISQQLRDKINFRPFNLLDNMATLGRFDLVFCRNVLIYFDQPTKTKVLDGISRQLAPDGFLVLGGAETVLGITDKFKPVDGQRGLYEQASATATGGVRVAG